ncbi:hypothetical protein DY000_02014510 [Brassica cretica]|uniref:Uncharacterized protein n=1 Tax=Brassica cretica TaxID=69181 RepID=A0ABQ7CVA2_BRACR|nr:hypothetical protein DY000_02014510 [Brassica cretica]
MAVDEHDELPETTQREAELQWQIDDLQGESAEKLNQLESKNLTLRDENQALNAASNKKRRFRTQVRPMPTLEIPNSRTGANLPTTAPGGDTSTREKAWDAQTYDAKWEEDVASRAKAQQKPDPKMIRLDRTKRDEKPSQRSARDSGNQNRGRYQNRPIEKAEGIAVSTWPDISNLSVSKPELINVLRQMDQQVKWPQKMKAPDSFRNPGFWCDFHRDHSHKMEDCVSLKIEVNELLRKGHLRDYHGGTPVRGGLRRRRRRNQDDPPNPIPGGRHPPERP